MYTIGSLADLISGKTTPNKPKVEVKEFVAKPFKTKSPKPQFSPKIVKTPETEFSPKQVKTLITEFSPKRIKTPKSAKKQKQIQGKTPDKFENKTPKKSPSNKTWSVDETSAKKFKSDNNSDEQCPKQISVNAKNAVKRMRDSKKGRLVDLEKDKRTIFVGNLPLSTKKKHLNQYFSKYGKIQSCRFRSATRANLNVPKKTAFITKQFHPNATTVNGYVVFENEDCVQNALASNGELFKENHIRVDVITSKEHNQKNAIYIGNMPFDAKDEDLWKIFADCGKIHSIRLVRDGLTGVGKGYGYVNFESSDSVELALQLHEVKIKNRELRIQRSSTSALASKKRNEKGEKQRKVPRKPQAETKTTENNNENVESETIQNKKTSKSFQGAKFTDKKKKNKKNKGELKKKKMSQILANNV